MYLSHMAGREHKHHAIQQRKNIINQHNHKLSSAWALWRWSLVMFRLPGMGMAGIPWNPREIGGNGYRYCGNTAGMELKVAGFPQVWDLLSREICGIHLENLTPVTCWHTGQARPSLGRTSHWSRQGPAECAHIRHIIWEILFTCRTQLGWPSI